MRRTERQHPYFAAEDSEGLRMLRRILITLSVYDPEVAYVQGMNEIVAPLLLSLQVIKFHCRNSIRGLEMKHSVSGKEQQY